VSGNGTFQVDLSGLDDGPITSSLSVSDAAANSFSAAGNTVVLDTDRDVTLTASIAGTAQERQTLTASSLLAGDEAGEVNTITYRWQILNG